MRIMCTRDFFTASPKKGSQLATFWKFSKFSQIFEKFTKNQTLNLPSLSSKQAAMPFSKNASSTALEASVSPSALAQS